MNLSKKTWAMSIGDSMTPFRATHACDQNKAFSEIELYPLLNHVSVLNRTCRPGIGSSAVSFAVVLLVVVGGVGLSSTTQPGLKSWSEPGSTSTNVTSTNGLQLVVSSNASELAVGQHLNVSLSIVNTLASINTVKPSNDWIIHGVPVALWPPCYFGLPVQVAVLQGSYNAHSIQAETSVSFNYSCMEAVTVDHVIFQPNSDWVSLTGLYDVDQRNQTLGPFQMSLSFTTGGYWDLKNLSSELNIPILGQQYPPREPAYVPFNSGEYTVAVADEWGQIAILHFGVQSTRSTSGAAASLACGQPRYLIDLAAMIEQTQTFAQQSHGLSYVLANGDNETGTTGQVGGKPYSTPPDTELTFYSYGVEPVNACPSTLGSARVVGVLWVHVPLSQDGSYNLANISVYFTPGLFTNSTTTG